MICSRGIQQVSSGRAELHPLLQPGAPAGARNEIICDPFNGFRSAAPNSTRCYSPSPRWGAEGYLPAFHGFRSGTIQVYLSGRGHSVACRERSPTHSGSNGLCAIAFRGRHRPAADLPTATFFQPFGLRESVARLGRRTGQLTDQAERIDRVDCTAESSTTTFVVLLRVNERAPR